MTVQDLIDPLSLRLLAGQEGLARQVDGGYVGDLLSWVMGRAREGSAWITVMGNQNAIAVAKLADLPCILLCESAPLDDDAKVKAEQNAIPVLASERPAYELALALSKLLETS